MTGVMFQGRHGLWMLIKWSVMAAAVIWMIIYRLSLDVVRLPEFVYVNF